MRRAIRVILWILLVYILVALFMELKGVDRRDRNNGAGGGASYIAGER